VGIKRKQRRQRQWERQKKALILTRERTKDQGVAPKPERRPLGGVKRQKKQRRKERFNQCIILGEGMGISEGRRGGKAVRFGEGTKERRRVSRLVVANSQCTQQQKKFKEREHSKESSEGRPSE